MAEKNFAITPSVNINRSKFLRTSHHKTSFNLGQIIPIYVDEVLPGDTRSIDFATLVRMSTPIAPIMDDIELELFAFFVPNRLTWTHWKDFMGENTAGAGYSTTVYQIPQVTFQSSSTGVLGDYMGIPRTASNSVNNLVVSELPLRAYTLIYNRWFRNQNVIAPYTILLGDDDQATQGGSLNYNISPFVACKKADYFTKALPYAQKGLPVSLPMGSFAPLITSDTIRNWDVSTGSQQPVRFGINATLAASSLNRPIFFRGRPDSGQTSFDKGVLQVDSATYSSSSNDYYITGSNLVADLSAATYVTINQLREAFAIQKALEKDALYGTRYWEILYGHFGVRAPDASLQDPEYLGGHRIMINVDQVLQTTGFDASSSSDLGKTGANSVTGGKGSLFTKSFVEHGWLMIMAVARQSKHTYAQGLNRMWSRKDKYDFYWPVFANLGAQEIKNKEIFADLASGSAAGQADAIFGYQEAWAEYRYKPSIATGLLNPTVTGSLDYWTLADKYSSLPTLGSTFVKETRNNIQRALVTGSSGPDFIADFYFQDTAVRPMPLYSIPGLIDHH